MVYQKGSNMAKCISTPKNPIDIPNPPNADARIIIIILSIEIESPCSGIINSATAPIATVITIGAPTIPAETAASPMIKAPTILIA